MIKNPSVLWFAPKTRERDARRSHDVPTGTGGSQLETGTEDRRYWGSVYVTLDHDGSLLAANAVSEDKLLAGLVPAEMYPDAPPAALEAQAIAARTELLQKIGRRNLTDPFLLCSTQQCQVYAGAGKEDPRTTTAVEQTRGMVLLRDGGGIVDIRYSASCGGHTEDNDAIWGGEPDPSLRGRADDPKGSMSRDHRRQHRRVPRRGRQATPGASAARSSARIEFRWTEKIRADDLDRAHRRRVSARSGASRASTPKQRGVVGPDRRAHDHRRQGLGRGHRRSPHPPPARRPQVDAVRGQARRRRRSCSTAPASATASACASWARSAWPTPARATRRSSATTTAARTCTGSTDARRGA